MEKAIKFIKQSGLLALVFIVLTSQVNAQKFSSKTKEGVATIFINSEELLNMGIKECIPSGKSTIYILDLNHLLKNYTNKVWNGHPLKVVESGPVIDSLSQTDAHDLFSNRKNYFVLREFKLGEESRLYFLHASSNKYVYGFVRKDELGLTITRFSGGVVN